MPDKKPKHEWKRQRKDLCVALEYDHRPLKVIGKGEKNARSNFF